VLTALRKDPERRYPSAGDFADDVRRHLTGQTVHARPDGWRLPHASVSLGGNRSRAVRGWHWEPWPPVSAFATVFVVRQPARQPADLPVGRRHLPVLPTVPDTAHPAAWPRRSPRRLSANLNGVGELRTVDGQALLVQTGSAANVAVARGAIVVDPPAGSGDLDQRNPRLAWQRAWRADAVLLDADGATSLAHVSATTAPEDLPALTDSLTWARFCTSSHTPAAFPRSAPALRARARLPALRRLSGGGTTRRRVPDAGCGGSMCAGHRGRLDVLVRLLAACLGPGGPQRSRCGQRNHGDVRRSPR
jgi:hypothetical protein